MYTLNLETLSEDRLRKAVDSNTYHLGRRLYEQGQVQVLDAAELSATCIVPDKRNYRVEIKVGREHIFLKCSCSHAGRGLICEHDVAAWLALRDRLEEMQPAHWQSALKQVLDAAQSSTPTRRKITPYILLFSLQPDLYTTGSDWQLMIYSLGWSMLPEALQALSEPSSTALSAYLRKSPELLAQARQAPSGGLRVEGCRNASPELVNLANMIERSRPRTYSYSYGYSGYNTPRPSTESYLALLRHQDILIFSGTSIVPLDQPLTLLPDPVEARLEIQRDDAGLHLSAGLFHNAQKLPAAAGDFQVLIQEPLWVRSGEWLFEMVALGGMSLLAQFESQDELLIPPDQEGDFMEQYLLPLARQFSLSGDAVAWENVQAAPVPRLYLSESNGDLLGQLRFAYGESEVRYDSNYPAQSVQRRSDSLTLLRVERDSDAERSAYDILGASTYGMKRAPQPAPSGQFVLRARTHPVDFLLNHVPRLAQDGFEVFGEEQLKTARVNRNTPTISFKVSSGIDWFDVKTMVNFGELEVAFSDIRRALRKRDRYVKLADGSIGELPQEWLERYRHLFSLGETTEDGVRVSRHHITLIEDALADADRTQLDADYQARRERLRALTSENFQGIAARPLPEGFTGELRPYQKSGYDWLHFLREFEFGGCLADDMGLGKTIQTLAFLESLYGGLNPRPEKACLLVVPRSLLINWQREAARFTPRLKILEYFNIARQKDLSIFDEVDLVITTYGVMLRDIELLHGYTFHYAILDESQAIKNPMSQTARAAHLLRADHRLVLTGTPIENSTAELWSQFAFLNPGLLGSLQYFKTEFGMPIEKRSDEAAANRLRRLVFPFILRRTKSQVAPELPPRTERTLFCDMSPAQRKLYNKMRDYYRGLLMGLMEKDGLNNSRMKILEGLLRLRQLCNHPLLVDDKFHGDSGKFELLLETLETLQSEGHKALIFSQFVQMLTLVRKELDARKVPYVYLDGSTTDRQDRVDTFQNRPDIPFFLISLKAGGLGLNLTAADYVIHIDPWWNPAVEMQASDRTHRIGQDKPVFVFKLIARDSVEEKILTLQERKRNLVDQIITTESSFFKNLTSDDVQALFS